MRRTCVDVPTNCLISLWTRANRYGLRAPIALGYSNGANIAAAIQLLRPDVLARAMLLRAMVPLRQPPIVDLTGKSVLIALGKLDRIIPVPPARHQDKTWSLQGHCGGESKTGISDSCTCWC